MVRKLAGAGARRHQQAPGPRRCQTGPSAGPLGASTAMASTKRRGTRAGVSRPGSGCGRPAGQRRNPHRARQPRCDVLPGPAVAGPRHPPGAGAPVRCCSRRRGSGPRRRSGLAGRRVRDAMAQPEQQRRHHNPRNEQDPEGRTAVAVLHPQNRRRQQWSGHSAGLVRPLVDPERGSPAGLGAGVRPERVLSRGTRRLAQPLGA